MVMSGGGEGDPRDDPDESKTELIDCSYQNHAEAIFRKGRHRGSTFRRAILDGADLTEGDFSECDFRRASMVEADLMKSAFDGAAQKHLNGTIQDTAEYFGYSCGICTFFFAALALLPLINARARLAFQEANKLVLVHDESE